MNLCAELGACFCNFDLVQGKIWIEHGLGFAKVSLVFQGGVKFACFCDQFIKGENVWTGWCKREI